MSEAAEVFFPAIRLNRSKQSRSRKCLFSASTSSTFGPKSRIEIYIEPDALGDSIPTAVEIMVYKSEAPRSKKDCEVYELVGTYKCPGTAYRYDEVIQNGKVRIGTVYLPEQMFGDNAPKKIWLEINKRPPVHSGT